MCACARMSVGVQTRIYVSSWGRGGGGFCRRAGWGREGERERERERDSIFAEPIAEYTPTETKVVLS